MKYARRSLRLYLSNLMYVIGIPIISLALMVAISVVIALIMGIVVGLPLPPEAANGTRWNIGGLTALPGFFISAGAMVFNRSFAMALAFGSTRRHFWLGTMLGFVLTSVVTGLAAGVFLWLEKLTGGWFVNVRAFDVVVLGNGDYLKAMLMTAVLSVLSLLLGALFGTVYRAFGTVATTVTAVGLGAVLLAAVALGVWQREAVSAFVDEWGLWAFVVMLAGLSLVVGVASYSANRSATI